MMVGTIFVLLLILRLLPHLISLPGGGSAAAPSLVSALGPFHESVSEKEQPTIHVDDESQVADDARLVFTAGTQKYELAIH